MNTSLKPINIYLIRSIFFTLNQRWLCLAPHLHFIQNTLLEVMWLLGRTFLEKHQSYFEEKEFWLNWCSLIFDFSLFSLNGPCYGWRRTDRFNNCLLNVLRFVVIPHFGRRASCIPAVDDSVTALVEAPRLLGRRLLCVCVFVLALQTQ